MSWQPVTDMLHGLYFLNPLWLWLWPLSVTAVAVLLHRHRLMPLARLPQWVGTRCFRHPRVDLLLQLRQQTTRASMPEAWRRWGGYAVLLLCVHVALAQPVRPGRQLPTPPEYSDTLFIIDTSVSMVLRDYLVAGQRADRMSILKGVLTHFIDQLDGNRIGLVAFSEQAYTVAPLTADYALLKNLVKRLQPAALTGRTSDVSKALLYTLNRLQEDGEQVSARQPVLVLITDVNRSDRDLDPRVIAAHLRDQGYRMHTIGIGASSFAAGEDAPAALSYQPANFTLLEAMASRGGGRFYWADNVASLQGAVDAIRSAERRQLTSEPRYILIPLYHWPLLAGLGWVLGLQLWAIRWRRR